MKTLAIVLFVSAIVGSLTWYVTPSETVAPLTYDVPVRLVSRDGDKVVFATKRCNNTASDLLVSVTAFWESQDHQTFIPVQPAGAGSATIPPGCTDRGGTNGISIAYLPAGTWRLRGSLCNADVCGGWYTDWVTR